MGLYDDEGQLEDLNPEEMGTALLSDKKDKKGKLGKGKAKKIAGFKMPPIVNKILLFVFAALIAVILIYSIYFSLQPSMISYDLKPNPTYMSDETTSNLKLLISNTSDETIKNAKVEVKPIDDLSLVIMPSDTIIVPILGAEEERLFDYKLNLIGNAPPGEYVILIKVTTPGEIYEERVKWEIKSSN
jgi:uncharacterized membrane protein